MAEQNFYVTKSGNDGNDGSSWADGNAWLTIQHAVDNANPANGTPIYIHSSAGTYAEQVDIDAYAGTDDDNRIIYDGDVENESGDGATRPIIDGEDTRNWCIIVSQKDYITIQDFAVKRAVYYGTSLRGLSCHYGIIERCIGYDNGRAAFEISAESITSHDGYHIIRNNIAYDNNISNLDIMGGIMVWQGGNYSKIYNNTSFHNKQNGVFLYGYNNNDGSNIIIKNNISHDNTVNQIKVSNWTFSNLIIDYNDLYADTGTRVGDWKGTTCATLSDWQTASSQDANSQEGDPLYVNEAGKDFRITDNASPCYQAGADLSAIFTDDYDQDTRVHWDIGADYIATVAVGLAKMVQIM